MSLLIFENVGINFIFHEKKTQILKMKRPCVFLILLKLKLHRKYPHFLHTKLKFCKYSVKLWLVEPVDVEI